MFRYRLFTVLVLLVPAVCHAQAQVELPPGVDYPRVNVGTGYQVDESWPAGKSAYPWKAMPGIAIDAEGMIWTVNRGEMPVQVYSPDGKLVTQWGKDYFISPHQIKIGRGGNIWVVDSHAHAVYKFTREGDKLLTIGIPGEPGDDDQHLKMPTDVIESPSGDLFISDGYRNNRVVHCNARGRFIRTWGELGVEPGQFSLPHAIDMDSRGRIYVADRNNCRVQVFSQRGKFLAEWKNLCMPWTVRVTSKDEVYVCGASPSQWRSDDVQLGIPPKDQVVLKLDTTGRLLSWWHFPSGPDEVDMGVKPGELSWVHGLAVDAEGNLYLGDIMGQRAQRFMLSK